ncbi:diketogulonate reductase-like aldo/keto reductase [Bacillus sp. SORGH_AS 510]|uniref:aldo/keto reductase n=1 Tax=Bacillus sp. SORGH_AS_0510 TaxID=3041771 RepID=UPI00278BA506|nr:aldo/keto reductase [Bacillus sp. SORGH_AS_0510]MDQ1145731.1 diketogulonate reductase-like aldo/keto reductase [Bacillus sp. SORGH_AS_0510]
MNSLQDTTTLHNGVMMPWLGLGVYKVRQGEEALHAVQHALRVGYKSIDTAALYDNEESVGQAIKESSIPREELFITTKVWNSDQRTDSVLGAFETSLDKLGLDYVDLYLVHWPVKEKYKETWKVLENLYKEGRVRAIGVSNFNIHHLEDLMSVAEIKPMVNQVELHPMLAQIELRDFCKKNEIQIEAWAPLGQGRLLEHPVLQDIASAHHKSIAQVILRWDLQNGIVTIPKSIKEHRIIENANIFDFTLNDSDLEKINALNENKRFGADPDNFDF